jgi:hypothetical protein
VIINKKKQHALKKTTKSETCVVAMCNMTDTDGYIHYSGAEIGK